MFGHDAGIGCQVAGDTSGVECTQRQLCTRLTDGLCSDDTDSFALVDHTTGGKVTSVTLGTNTTLGLTGQYGTDFYAFNRRIFNLLRNGLRDFLTGSDNQFARSGMDNIVNGNTSQDAFVERRDDLIVVLQSRTNQSTERSAVFFIDDHIVRHIDQTTSQVSGVGCLQCRIGQTLTCTVRRDKVLQHGKTFLKVRKNRVLDNLCTFCTGFLRLRHQTTHTGKLTDLFFRTTGTGIQHHEYGIEALVVFRNRLHQDV